MTDQQIEHMTQRFLQFPFPETMSPDGGLSFRRKVNEGTQYEHSNRPTGTNLLDYSEAKAMVQHMLEGLPGA